MMLLMWTSVVLGVTTDAAGAGMAVAMVAKATVRREKCMTVEVYKCENCLRLGGKPENIVGGRAKEVGGFEGTIPPIQFLHI